jgi:predicted transposase YbfD/YdcC
VLGQVKADDKSNETTAMPKLLEVLALKGCIVTIDAMGCQTAMAGKIVEKGADYILAVKGNQGRLEEDVKATIRLKEAASESMQTETEHGRIEIRKCFVYDDLSVMETGGRWDGLKSVIRIESSRYVGASGTHETQTRLYISSLKLDAKTAGEYVRAHWGIENRLHWVLDVAFNEDESRKRAGFAAQNFSTLNRIALNLLKNETSKKRSVRGKRLDAGWNNEYLLNILRN